MQEPPSVQRIAELNQLVADFASVERAIELADKERPENDVEHSYSLALTCWFIAPKIAPELNMEKVFKYALAHDIVEVHAGDTFIFDEEKLANKSEREDRAIEEIKKEWPDFEELPGFAKGYKDKVDEEAKFVYVIDKMLPPIMINLGEKDKFWAKNKITQQMHTSKKHEVMMVSAKASIYYQKLIDWLNETGEFYKEEN